MGQTTEVQPFESYTIGSHAKSQAPVASIALEQRRVLWQWPHSGEPVMVLSQADVEAIQGVSVFVSILSLLGRSVGVNSAGKLLATAPPNLVSHRLGIHLAPIPPYSS